MAMEKKIVDEWSKIKDFNIFSNINEFAKLFLNNPNGSCFKKYSKYEWSKDNFFFGTYDELIDFYKKSLEIPFYLNKYIGKTFGQLTINNFSVEIKNNKRRYFAICMCDCGRECKKEFSKIVNGHVKTCGNHKRKHKNDLLTNYPDVIKNYWDYSKNQKLPEDVNITSNEDFWWKDSTGSFKMKPTELTRKHGGTSFNEQCILYYCNKIFRNTKSRYRIQHENKAYEIDIFLPDINLGIEYDGVFWHQNKADYDMNKAIVLSNYNINLLRIREKGLDLLQSANMDSIICDYKSDFSSTLKIIIAYIKDYIKRHDFLIGDKEKQNINNFIINEDIFDNDKLQILNQYRTQYVANNITTTCLIRLWDYNKNSIIPQKISIEDDVKVWFTCPYGFSRKINIKSICSKHVVSCNNNINCLNCKSVYCPLAQYCNRWYGGCENHCKQMLKYYYYRAIYPNEEHDKLDKCYYCNEEIYSQYISKQAVNVDDDFYDTYNMYKYYLNDIKNNKQIPDMKYFKRCELNMSVFNKFDEVIDFVKLWSPNITSIKYKDFDTKEIRPKFLEFLKDYMTKNKYKVKCFQIFNESNLSNEMVTGLIKIIKKIFPYRKNPDYIFLYNNYSKYFKI